MRWIVLYVLPIAFLSCTSCTATDTWEILIPGDPVPGVRHLHRVTNDPLNIHVLIVDLKNPRVRIRAGLKNDNDKPDEGETVKSICQRYNAVAGINCDYFAMSADQWNDFRHIPQGHNMTDGLLMLPPGRSSPIVPDRSAMAFPLDNSYGVVGIFMAPQAWWWNVVAGGPRIIRNGTVGWEVEPDIPDQTSRQPRTGAAISADYRTLILATVDGRQPSSRGMTANELGYLLKEFGGYNGLSFDGGGSTTMVINGNTVNSPSDGVDRRIANCLMILDKARQGGTQVLFESNFEAPVYHRGSISGQHGWIGSGTVALEGRNGSRCARFSGEGAYRSVSPNPVSGIQWLEYWMKFSSNDTVAYLVAGTAGCTSVGPAVRLVGNQMEAYDTDQFGNAIWARLADLQPNTWYRIAVRIDYYIKRYQVLINGAMKLSGASFKDSSSGVGLQCIRFEEVSGAGEVYIDDIYVGNADPDYLRITPDSLTTVKGACTKFKSAGGTSPIIWTIAEEKFPDGSLAPDGAIAQVNSDGLVTANSPGSFFVQAKDQIGRTDRSDKIIVLEPESINDVKSKPDGTLVGIYGAVVSAIYDQFIYVQDPEKLSGVRIMTDFPVLEGSNVWVVGTLETVDGERVIQTPWLEIID
jgi:exopolysaccharide biosynthesis protein